MRFQIDGLRESVKEILNLIRTMAVLISPDRIILGGIGQRCASAIPTLLYDGIRLGGFIGLSSWLLFELEATTMADNTAWSIVGNRLHYSRKLLNTPTDQEETTSILSDPDSNLRSRPRSSCHTRGTMMLFLLPMERSYPRHWKISAWRFRENSTEMEDTGSMNLKEWMTSYRSFIHVVESSSTKDYPILATTLSKSTAC